MARRRQDLNVYTVVLAKGYFDQLKHFLSWVETNKKTAMFKVRLKIYLKFLLIDNIFFFRPPGLNITETDNATVIYILSILSGRCTGLPDRTLGRGEHRNDQNHPPGSIHHFIWNSQPNLDLVYLWINMAERYLWDKIRGRLGKDLFPKVEK